MLLQSSQYAKTVSNTREDLNERIDAITKFTSRPYFNKALKKLALECLDNAAIICDYINAEQNEINIKPSTIEGKVKILIRLSNFHRGKLFNLLTRQDILSYLNSLRKSIDKDLTHTKMDWFIQWKTNDYAKILQMLSCYGKLYECSTERNSETKNFRHKVQDYYGR